MTSEYLPEFDAIEAEVEAVWRDDAKRAENEAALKKLIETYRVEVGE